MTNEAIPAAAQPPSSAGKALTRALAEQARADIRQDLAARNAFLEAHGSFAAVVRSN